MFKYHIMKITHVDGIMVYNLLSFITIFVEQNRIPYSAMMKVKYFK